MNELACPGLLRRLLATAAVLCTTATHADAAELPTERASRERITTEIRLSMEAGSPHYQAWPGGGTTIHNGTGYLEPFGRAEYSCGLDYPEQRQHPLPSHINADWKRAHSVEGLLFCVYTLADGAVYAYDSIAGHLMRDSGNGERRDVLINIVVGGSGVYAGATGTWIGRAQGRGTMKEVAPGRRLPMSILKLMEGYISVPTPSLAAAARPAADPMADYYGNTLICSGPTWECHMWLNADGTYAMFALDVRDGKPRLRALEGKWALLNGRFCRDPDDTERNSCNAPLLDTHEEGRKLGETWQGINRGGQPESFQLVPGRR